MSNLPKERLTWFRLNAIVAKTYADCEWCKKVQTKGRDRLGGGLCDACIARINPTDSRNEVKP